MKNKIYKRTSREMPQSVKDKIRAAMTGRKLSQETKNKISRGQKNAWARIPHIQPQTLGNNNSNSTEHA